MAHDILRPREKILDLGQRLVEVEINETVNFKAFMRPTIVTIAG
jgi:hypothetical protein